MIEIIKLAAATLLAMGLAWLWDRLLTVSGINQPLRVGISMPVGEEMIKFVVFKSLNLPPLLFYSLFGLAEGLYESLHVSKRFKITLIFTGSLIHLIFGLFYLTDFSGYLQLLLAINAHILWNYAVLYRKKPNK